MSNAKTKVQSTYVKLKSINVNDCVEKKGNQSYISWANAWDLLKTHCPDAQRKVYEHDHTGLNYFTDGTLSDEYFVVEGYINNYEKVN